MTPKLFEKYFKERNYIFGLTSIKKLLLKYHITLKEVLGKSRIERITKGRREIWVYLKTYGFTYMEIGRLFNREYTTIIKTIKKQRMK